MGLSFLRLFAAFRAIEAELVAVRESHAQLASQKLLLEDRLNAAQEERERIWLLTQEALRGERMAYQSHVNLSWQKMGGGTPYPDAPHLPPAAVPQPDSHEPVGRQARVLPSEIVARETRKFMQAYIREQD